MAKQVLVPLDGTKNAEKALDALKEICSRDDEFTLLAVLKPQGARRAGFTIPNILPGGVVTATGGIAETRVPDVPSYAETDDQALQSQIDTSRDYLEHLATGLRQDGFGVQIEVLVSDDADDAIIDFARKTRPTFIAMLRRSHAGLGELLFGSVAMSVARSDVAPVLFLPPVT